MRVLRKFASAIAAAGVAATAPLACLATDPGLFVDACHTGLSGESSDDTFQAVLFEVSDAAETNHNLYVKAAQDDHHGIDTCAGPSNADYAYIHRLFEFPGASENKEYAIVVRTTGEDALYIDQAIWGKPDGYEGDQDDSDDFHRWAYFGRDVGDGWCLSTDSSDGGDWSKYIADGVGCRVCFEYRTWNTSVYYGTDHCSDFDKYYDD